MTKSSLYYHFKNKEEILITLLQQRRKQLDELLEWLKAQPPAPDLRIRTAHRWISETTSERLKLMIVSQANQPMMARLSESGQDIRKGFDEVIQHFVGPEHTFEAQLLVRMTFDTLTAALKASRGLNIDYDSILKAAYQTATVISELADRALAPE